MNNLKLKSIVALFFAMIVSFALVSCGDDDDKSNSPIVGTWTGTTTYSDGDVESFTFVFKSNGSFTGKAWNGDVDDFDPSDFGVAKGKYDYDEDLKILTLKGVDEDGDEYTEYMSCTISGNKMVWVSADFDEPVILTKK